MKDNQKKYEEAAKEYVQWNNLKIPGEADGQEAFRIWMAGASFAEKEKTLEYKLAIETAAILKEQRDEALDKLKEQQEAFTSMTSNATAFKFWNELKKQNEELKSSNDGIQQTNIEAYAMVKQLQEENQRLKEALKKTLLHWLKMDKPELCEEDYDNASKLLEP